LLNRKQKKIQQNSTWTVKDSNEIRSESCPLRDLWIIVDQSAYKAAQMTIYRNVRIAEQQTT